MVRHYGVIVKPDDHISSLNLEMGSFTFYDIYEPEQHFAQQGVVRSVGNKTPWYSPRVRGDLNDANLIERMAQNPEFLNSDKVDVGDTVVWRYQYQIDKEEGELMRLGYDALVAKISKGKFIPLNGWVFLREIEPNIGLVWAVGEPNKDYKMDDRKDKTIVKVGDKVTFTSGIRTFTGLHGEPMLRVLRPNIMEIWT